MIKFSTQFLNLITHSSLPPFESLAENSFCTRRKNIGVRQSLVKICSIALSWLQILAIYSYLQSQCMST